MEKIEVSLEILNEMLGYLGTRPYQEVYGMIEKLQNEAKAHNMRMTAQANEKIADEASNGDGN